ncbi:MAG TPA: phosphoribosylglycinamide synthetase C domain-containing protein, partial [Acidimicrobiales bacterium]|nr:phosphoribosylglycinamide synthetase C domain-containing protein [Acidimicrobiales bacterium]
EAAAGDLRTRPRSTSEAAVCVVMAATGYPGDPRRGDRIEGLEAAAAVEGVTVYHAGTARRDGELVTAGGRVLGVTGCGPSLDEARRRAYEAVAAIRWAGAQYRTDIGLSAVGGLAGAGEAGTPHAGQAPAPAPEPAPGPRPGPAPAASGGSTRPRNGPARRVGAQ